jgi:hypothetical protein
MAVSSNVAVQQGIEDSTIGNYYDMMIIGKTGIGKSTTSDKLVMANHGRHDHHEAVQPNAIQPGERLVVDDLCIWSISDADGELERVWAHLENLLGFAQDPNASIDSYYSSDDRTTLRAQLISNDVTNVRVLDVPGFFGDTAYDRATGDTPSDVAKSGLAIMRQVLRVQEAMKLNFKRIIYFIPERGPLERPNKILQIELEQMVHYFGVSIFDCMVLVTTVNPDIYQYLPPGIIPFSSEAEVKTRANFNATLKRVLPNDQLPEGKPPLVFLSKRDSYEGIMVKIKDAPVIHDELRLQFDIRTCARCGMKEKILCQGKEEVKMACYSGEDPSVAIPYEDSFCHPMIVSKHWKMSKVLGGIAHFVTKGRYVGSWPDFRNPDDEICIHCGKVPGSRGCMKAGSRFTLKGESFQVLHSPSLERVEVDAGEI